MTGHHTLASAATAGKIRCQYMHSPLTGSNATVGPDHLWLSLVSPELVPD